MDCSSLILACFSSLRSPKRRSTADSLRASMARSSPACSLCDSAGGGGGGGGGGGVVLLVGEGEHIYVSMC